MVQKKQKGVGIALNMLLVLIIAALYLVTSQPDMLPVPFNIKIQVFYINLYHFF